MSLPNTNREMLLSAALDGELSVQEQVEFDRALASDPAFAREYEELQSLRLDVKATLSRFREQKPASDFASRIVAAAFEQAAPIPAGATRRGPAQAQPHQDRSSQEPSHDGRWIRMGSACALAASVLIAIGFWNRDQLDDLFARPTTNALADLSNLPSVIEPNATLNDQKGSLVLPPTDVIATNSPPVDKMVSEEPIKVMGIKPLPGSEQANTNPKDDERMAPSPGSIAAAGEPVNSPSATQVTAATSPTDKGLAPQPDRQPLSLVLVIAVELTSEGRRELALQEALRAADIRIGQESIVKSQVVSHLRDTNVIRAAEDGEQAQLYFIEAPTKQIDRLVNRLMTSPQAIASVGLSLAMDPPLLAAVGDLREIDPTKVRQDPTVGFARDIRAINGQAMSFDAGSFAPMDQAMSVSDVLQMQASPDNAPTSGDDSPSQLLLFVK